MTPPLAPIANDDERPITRSQAERLIAATERLADTNTWRKVARVVVYIVVAVTLILSGASGALYLRVSSDASCVRQWAVATSVRSVVLTDGRRDLDDATNALILTAIPDPNTTRAQQVARFNTVAQTYRAASAKYQELLDSHPVPPAPAFNC